MPPLTRALPRLGLTGLLLTQLLACSLTPVTTKDPGPALAANGWRLSQLAEVNLGAVPAQRLPYLELQPDGQRLSGSDGCNRLLGQYQQQGQQLSFGTVGSTRMACPDRDKLASRFQQMLGQVARFRVQNQQLELLNQAGELLAQFTAQSRR